jgi:hypothetical protein
MTTRSTRHDEEALAWLRSWSVLLDARFRVPGTNIRFGLDPILGLIPGIGDLAAPIFAVVLLIHGARMRIPRIVLVRMLLNAGIDFLFGLVPGIGNVFDVFWKANLRNLRLLERHARPGATATTGDWVFVGLIIGVLAAIVLVPVVLIAWLLSQLV